MASSSTADEDRRWIVLTMVCLALTLGLSSLALRGYVKLRVRKVVTADDWIMLIAGVSTPGISLHLSRMSPTPIDFHFKQSSSHMVADFTMLRGF